MTLASVNKNGCMDFPGSHKRLNGAGIDLIKKPKWFVFSVD
jgi:hypothetical protein